MNKHQFLSCVLACGLVVSVAATSQAVSPYMHGPLLRAELTNWHANYAHSAYGYPVSLVVPPTAQLQTNWSWGAPSMNISRIDHQFGRNYPGPGPFGAGFRRTPPWPSNTHQFGVYHVRAPWFPTQF